MGCQIEVAFVCFPYSLADLAQVATAADAAGNHRLFGIADSPALFGESYVAQHDILSRTSNLVVGPFATNPVTRHWSVHAASHRSLEELFPGRGFLGIATGDSAVHSFGLRPSTASVLQEHVHKVREFGPDRLRVVIPAGGLKAARTAGLAADDLVVAQGIDPGATQELVRAAMHARRAGGITAPMTTWLYVLADVWESEEAAAIDRAAREAFDSMIMAYSRQALAFTFEGKNVPKELRPGLRELYANFSFERYTDPHNARLMETFAAEKEFVSRRFAIRGTPEALAQQLRNAVKRTGVSKVWLGLLSQDAAESMRLVVERLLPTLAPPSATSSAT